MGRDNQARIRQARQLNRKQGRRSPLDRPRALDGTLRNDLKQKAGFHAVASVPCFELWLLLHFSEVSWEYSLHRREVVRRLRSYLQDYEKGSGGHFEQTRDLLEDALRRSERLVDKNNVYDGKLPFTNVGKLVAMLQKLGRG